MIHGDASALLSSNGGKVSGGETVSGTFYAKHPEGEFLAKGTGHFSRTLFAISNRTYR
jgi:hypothetical protein